VRNGIMILSKQ